MNLAKLTLNVIKAKGLLRYKHSLQYVPDNVYSELKSIYINKFDFSGGNNRYEDLDVNFETLNSTVSSYLNEAREIRNLVQLDNVGIEMIATSGANAYAIYVPEDKSYAIGIDDNILNIFLIVLLSVFQIISSPESDKQEKIAQTARLLVEDVLTTYRDAVIDDVDKIDRIKLIGDAQQWMLDTSAYLAKEFAERFIVFHEIGHIALNHHSRNPTLYVNAAVSHQSMISAFTHDLEFEADEWAHETLNAVMKQKSSYHITVSTLTAITFFKLFSIVEQLLRPASDIDGKYLASHPPASERAYRLGKDLRIPEFEPTESSDIKRLHTYIEVLTFTSNILDFLGKDNKLLLLAKYYLRSKK